jgi:hypothetical protein
MMGTKCAERAITGTTQLALEVSVLGKVGLDPLQL